MNITLLKKTLLNSTTHIHRCLTIIFLCLFGVAFADNPDWFPPSEITLEEGVESVMIQADPAGRFFANGKINGIPVRFHLDTGASSISIPSRIADRLNLDIYGDGISQTAAGEIKIQGAILKSVSLGGIVITNLDGRVNSSNSNSEILLGNEFLRHLDITIKGTSLILNARNTASALANPHPEYHTGLDKLILEADSQGHYFISGRINGSIVHFLIDTGADNIVIPASIARRLRLPKLQEIGVKTAGGDTTGYITGPFNVSAGRLKVDNMYGIISPKMNARYGLIGLDFLKNFDFEQQGNKLILTIPK